MCVTDITHHHRKHTLHAALNTNSSPGDTTTVTIYQLHESVSPLLQIVVQSHDQYALKAGFTHSLRQILHAVSTQWPSSLIWAVFDPRIRQLLHYFISLWRRFDHLINGCRSTSLTG